MRMYQKNIKNIVKNVENVGGGREKIEEKEKIR